MNKKIFQLFLTIFLSMIFLTDFTLAQIPGIPHQFFGDVNFLDGSAPDGLSVVAKIEGEEVASTTTLNGRYGYEPYVFSVSDPNNNRIGKTIHFFVNGVQANENAVFLNGNITELDLTLNTNKPVPPTPTTVPSVGGGGGGIRVTTTTTTTTIPKPICGDDVCETGEDCSNCPEDCGECPKVRMDIVDIDIPENITADTPFEISVTVKNVGDEKGSDEITLALPKGWKSDAWRKSVTLDVGQSTTLKFTITPDESSGEIAIGSSIDLEKSGEIIPRIIAEKPEILPITGMIIALIESVDWMIFIVVIVVVLIAFFAVVKKFKKEKYKKFKYKFRPKKR